MTFKEATRQAMQDSGMPAEEVELHLWIMDALNRFGHGTDVQTEIPKEKLEEYREWITAQLKTIRRRGFYLRALAAVLKKLSPSIQPTKPKEK